MVIIGLLAKGFLVTSLASYFVARQSLRARIALSELPLTSDNIYSKIRHDLSRPVFLSTMMATDTFLRDWILEGEIDKRQIIKYLCCGDAGRSGAHQCRRECLSEKNRNAAGHRADLLLLQANPG